MEVELKTQINFLRSIKTTENRDLINKEIRELMKKLYHHFKNFIECDICFEIVKVQDNNKCTNKKCSKNYCDDCIDKIIELDKCAYCRCDLSKFDYYNIVCVKFIEVRHFGGVRREVCVFEKSYFINKKTEIDYNILTNDAREYFD